MVDFRVYAYYNKYMKYRMYVRYEGGFYMTINEMKEKKMINHDYWIDILQGMQEVNSKYWDYEFIY